MSHNLQGWICMNFEHIAFIKSKTIFSSFKQLVFWARSLIQGPTTILRHMMYSWAQLLGPLSVWGQLIDFVAPAVYYFGAHFIIPSDYSVYKTLSSLKQKVFLYYGLLIKYSSIND